MIQPFYVPFLRAKAGEFSALKNLPNEVKSKMLPLLDIPKNTSKAKIPKTTSEHLDCVIGNISSVWKGRALILEAFTWDADSLTEDGEHIMGYLQSNLEKKGVPVYPVIGYDRWDDLSYQAAFENMHLPEDRCFCIRLDNDAISDIADIDYFKDRIDQMLLCTGSSYKDCIALIDLGDISKTSISETISGADETIKALKSFGFEKLVVIGSSIPTSIDQAVKEHSSEGYIQRKEMLIWQSLFQTFQNLVLGDYGVRNPKFNDDVIAPDANGKIRYTTPKAFYIARGYSLRQKKKFQQHHDLAAKIVSCPHFLGANFSWGDNQIVACANKEFSGNATTWIAIDTNHHIHASLQEIREFLQTVPVKLETIVE